MASKKELDRLWRQACKAADAKKIKVAEPT